MCRVSAEAATGYTPNSPALPIAAKFPPTLEASRSALREQTIPQFAGISYNYCSTAEGSHNECYISNSESTGDLTLLEPDAHYSSYFNDQTANTVYFPQDYNELGNITSRQEDNMSCYSTLVSSPILGLNDSLEELETSNMLATKESDLVTHGKAQGMFPEPWNQPDKDFQFASKKPDFINQASLFSRAAHFASKGGLPHHVRACPSPVTEPVSGSPQTVTKFATFNPAIRQDFLNSDMCSVSQRLPGVQLPWNSEQHETTSTQKTLVWSSSANLSEEDRTGHHFSTGECSRANTHNSSRIVSSWTSDAPLQKQCSDLNISSYLHNTSPQKSPIASSVFDEGCLIPRSSKAIASQVVRKPRQTFPATEHKPVKALDLGLESEREKNVRLQSNDRIMASIPASSSSFVGGADWSGRNVKFGDSSGEIVRSKYFPTTSSAASSMNTTGSSLRVISSSRVSLCGAETGKMADLKAFHQRQHEGALSSRQVPPGISQLNNTATEKYVYMCLLYKVLL